MSLIDGVAVLPIDHLLLRADPAAPALDGRSGRYSYAELEQTLGQMDQRAKQVMQSLEQRSKQIGRAHV